MKQVILWWYNREKRLLKYKLTKYVCSCHDKVFWWTLDREYKLFLFLIDNTEWKPYLHKPYLLYRPKNWGMLRNFLLYTAWVRNVVKYVYSSATASVLSFVTNIRRFSISTFCFLLVCSSITYLSIAAYDWNLLNL